MAGAATGDIIRVRLPIPLLGRLLALPLIAAGAYLLWNVALGLSEVLASPGDARDEWAGIAVFAALGVAVIIPGLLVATFRGFVTACPGAGEVVITKAFGPLHVRRARRLSNYNLISITDDGDVNATMYEVNLCGGKGVEPLNLRSFASREEANALAQQLAIALKIPAKDYVGTEPDDDDADG
ncbi:hypothetical protein ACQR1W_28820 [Bradyrhizobium sp. HKCCYLS1011]|uniref:hypothetical protein n=1 Tax=Bradyrhizobium sp. HKCCYLS1011 TaxID=3420733 RepID=UPI003EB7CFC2